MSDLIFAPLEDKPQELCVDELNEAWECLMIDPSACPCFDVPSFADTFHKEIRKQFYSTQAWLPPTDTYFCEVANQRVCQHYDIMQSCCCNNVTTKYRECLINNILVWELPIPQPCTASCDKETVPEIVERGEGPYETKSSTTGSNNKFVTMTLVIVLCIAMIIIIVAAALILIRYKRHNMILKKHASTRSLGRQGISSSTINTTKKQSEKLEDDDSCQEKSEGNEVEDGIDHGTIDDPSTSDHSTIKTAEVPSLYCIEDGINTMDVPAVDMTPSIYQKSQKQETNTTTACKNQKLFQIKKQLKKERSETRSVLSKLDKAIRVCEERIERSKSHSEQLNAISADSNSVTTREALKKDIKDSQEKIHRLEEAMKIYAQRLSETEVELERFRKDNPNLINEVPY
jgi:hypothetical protein